MFKDVIAIIPARSGSKSIPKKNIIDFCGKPLIAWSIAQALHSEFIKEVFVSSDDREILKVASGCYAKLIARPKKLATDVSSAEDALLHAIGYVQRSKKEKIDIVVFLQATSPIRTNKDIDNAIKFFVSKKADSLFSAALLEDFCTWQIKGNRYNSITYDYKNRGRRQDRKPYYLENGSIYIFKPEILKKYKNRLGGKIVTYPMPLWQSYEIDSYEDLEICEYFMRNKILCNERAKWPIRK